jgi:hypothetical protein
VRRAKEVAVVVYGGRDSGDLVSVYEASPAKRKLKYDHHPFDHVWEESYWHGGADVVIRVGGSTVTVRLGHDWSPLSLPGRGWYVEQTEGASPRVRARHPCRAEAALREGDTIAIYGIGEELPDARFRVSAGRLARTNRRLRQPEVEA